MGNLLQTFEEFIMKGPLKTTMTELVIVISFAHKGYLYWAYYTG